MNGVVRSGSKSRLLEYVRLLRHHCCTLGTGRRYPMRNLPKDSGEYLSNLHNIRSLGLADIRIEPICEEGLRTCFSAFRETLTDLTLHLIDTSFSAFITLVDYFPNITALQLGWFIVKPDEGPVPQLSRPLRGKIWLSYVNPDCAEFFSRLAELDLEYEELIIETYMEAELLETVLQLGASTVKYLRLTAEIEGEYP